MMRALALEYPRDPSLATLDLEYLFGPDFLVAPMYESTGPHVVIAGPGTCDVGVPLERVPLYVRGGALIPTIEPV
jgi:alpha-D-xyloside xylohydrolase